MGNEIATVQTEMNTALGKAIEDASEIITRDYLGKLEGYRIAKPTTEDLDIDIDKNHLTINAKKEEEHEEDTKGYRKSEFKYGDFSRTVYFPMDIDVEKTEAKLEHGILSIIAPKVKAETEGIKKLTVK